MWWAIFCYPLDRSLPEKARIAFARLCEDYWPPLYRFVRQRGYSRHDAQDLTQGFSPICLEKQAYGTPDRSKGRFRTFLLVLLKRYLGAARAPPESTKARRQPGDGSSRQRRSSTVLDKAALDALSSDAPQDEERLFEWNWATTLVSRAMAELGAEYSRRLKVATLG